MKLHGLRLVYVDQDELDALRTDKERMDLAEAMWINQGKAGTFRGSIDEAARALAVSAGMNPADFAPLPEYVPKRDPCGYTQ